MNSKIEGFYILTGEKGETLAFHCSRCACDYIISKGSAPKVFCCGRFKEHKPEQPSGLLGFFSGPAELPRVRFKEKCVRPIHTEESESPLPLS